MIRDISIRDARTSCCSIISGWVTKRFFSKRGSLECVSL